MRFPGILIAAFTITTAIGAPEARFLILRTDSKVAESLQNAITGGSLADDLLEEKISSLISQNTITELADFQGPLKGRKEYEKSTGKIEIREISEAVPMGVRLDINSNISSEGPLADLRFHASIMEKSKRLRYQDISIATAATLKGNGWHWLHHWRRADDTTILLTRISALPESKEEVDFKVPNLLLNYELLAVSEADLEKFGKSTPATRAKAATWLRERAEVLDASRISCRPGERALHENEVEEITDKNGGWDTWSMGASVQISPNIGPAGKMIDLHLTSKWQDPSVLKPEPDYRFEIKRTLETGLTKVVHPTTKPGKAESEVILLLTPEVRMPNTPPFVEETGPIGEGIVSRTYLVPPQFMRVLKESSNAEGYPALKDLLMTRGMAFLEGTRAISNSRNSTVTLRHDKSGHATFVKIRESIRQEG